MSDEKKDPGQVAYEAYWKPKSYEDDHGAIVSLWVNVIDRKRAEWAAVENAVRAAALPVGAIVGRAPTPAEVAAHALAAPAKPRCGRWLRLHMNHADLYTLATDGEYIINADDPESHGSVLCHHPEPSTKWIPVLSDGTPPSFDPVPPPPGAA